MTPRSHTSSYTWSLLHCTLAEHINRITFRSFSLPANTYCRRQKEIETSVCESANQAAKLGCRFVSYNIFCSKLQHIEELIKENMLLYYLFQQVTTDDARMMLNIVLRKCGQNLSMKPALIVCMWFLKSLWVIISNPTPMKIASDDFSFVWVWSDEFRSL